MSPTDSHKEYHEGCLSAVEAAAIMGVSVDTVRELCAAGVLGAYQEHGRGPWHIPIGKVEEWNKGRRQPRKDIRYWLERLRKHPISILLSFLAGVLVLIAALVSAGADLPGATHLLLSSGIVRGCRPRSGHEILIIIAAFTHDEGATVSGAHNEIRREIEMMRDSLAIPDLRIELAPAALVINDRTSAEKLGNRCKASIVIWGSNTGARFTTHFLNFDKPEFDAAKIEISKKGNMAPSNPDYVVFVTEDLPGQLAFLSLFAIGQSYYLEGDLGNSIKTIERAVAVLSPGVRLEGLAEAYLWLGWLYQVPMNKSRQAIEYYDQAVLLKPDLVAAYLNRAIAHMNENELEAALSDYDALILRSAHLACTQSGSLTSEPIQSPDQRGPQPTPTQVSLTVSESLMKEKLPAVSEPLRGSQTEKLVNSPPPIPMWPNRDEVDPAQAYWGRGIVRREMGQTTSSLMDFRCYLELRPDAPNRQVINGWIAAMSAVQSSQ